MFNIYVYYKAKTEDIVSRPMTGHKSLHFNMRKGISDKIDFDRLSNGIDECIQLNREDGKYISTCKVDIDDVTLLSEILLIIDTKLVDKDARPNDFNTIIIINKEEKLAIDVCRHMEVRYPSVIKVLTE